MRLYAFLFVLITTAIIMGPSTKAKAQNENIENPRVIGILGLPPLCYWDCEDYDIPVPLYETPDQEGVPATYLLYNDIENWPDFEEYEYEAAGALIYERQNDNWYKIKRHEEFFWIYHDNPDDFIAYPEILYDRLTFLITKTEQPAIRDEPDKNLPGRPFTHDFMQKNYGEVPVKIIETRLIGNEWWVKVGVQDSLICLKDNITILFEGWIPAYNNNNERNFWYYPRGC